MGSTLMYVSEAWAVQKENSLPKLDWTDMGMTRYDKMEVQWNWGIDSPVQDEEDDWVLKMQYYLT